LELAGLTALKAGSFLTGDGDDDDISVRDIADLAGSALHRAHAGIGAAASLVARIGDEVDDIRIPTFEPTYSEVAGFKVVTGVDFGEASVVDKVAGRIRDGAEQLRRIAEEIGDASANVGLLGAKISDAGADLGKAGDRIQSSGEILRGVSGVEPVDEALELSQGRTRTNDRAAAMKRKVQARKRTAAGKKAAAESRAWYSKPANKSPTATKKQAKAEPQKRVAARRRV
jgi:hypothetical protein